MIRVIYYSKFHTVEKIAQQIAIGAKSFESSDVELIPSSDATERIEELNKADGIILGAPTYFGSLPSEMKGFLDTLGQVWINKKWQDKICAGFTHSNTLSGDKLMTLMQMMIFAMQHGMVWVGTGLLPNEAITVPEEWSDLASGDMKVNKLGAWIGMMSQGNQGEELDKSHLLTARLFGRRIAEMVKKLRN
jgi:multimeric flavodoxin WrbA